MEALDTPVLATIIPSGATTWGVFDGSSVIFFEIGKLENHIVGVSVVSPICNL